MESAFTCGDYEKETEAATAFDNAISQTGLFSIFREITGQILQPRLDASGQLVRIDRILSPKPKLREAGWKAGMIGVDIKASGKKMGPILAQLLDYSRAVWRLPGGYDVMCRLNFIFPVKKQAGLCASIMAQHRIGGITEYGHGTHWHKIDFYCGHSKALRYRFNDNYIEIGDFNFGCMSGSR
jgi:hypothetical protein